MVKIAIKFGILIIILVVMFLAFNLFVRKAMDEKTQVVNNEIMVNSGIAGGLNLMLSHHESWSDILGAQKRDLEYIRAVLPEAPFRQKFYLRTLLDVFDKSGVYSNALFIKPVRPAAGKVNYYQFFETNMGALASYIEPFDKAFSYLKGSDSIKGVDRVRFDSLILKPNPSDEELELALWYSFRFNQMMAVNIPEGISLLPGLEMHRFDTTVAGSYDDIKHFLWQVRNMVPHTIIVNWHLRPGAGAGESRPYTASLNLITFVDANIQPNYEIDPSDPYFPMYQMVQNMPNISQLLQLLKIKPLV